MKLFFSFLFLFASMFGAGDANASQSVLKLAPGSHATIKLSENPSTGYSWKIDRQQSSNLDILRIDDGGVARGGGNLIGAPGTHKWSVEALSPGQAIVDFVYQRPWENAPVRTHRVTVQVKTR